MVHDNGIMFATSSAITRVQIYADEASDNLTHWQIGEITQSGQPGESKKGSDYEGFFRGRFTVLFP